VLVVADINTLWRSRPFEALAELTPVLGLAPQDRLVALRSRQRPWGIERSGRGCMEALRVVMPFRWASRRAEGALPRLWKAVQDTAVDLNQIVHGLVVTSPHYLPLCRQVSGTLPIFYYCSDDYRSYAGWGAKDISKTERDLARLARHSFFVSEELRARAVSEYGVAKSVTSVSMNATEEAFMRRIPVEQLEVLRAAEPRLKRPIVGVVGGVNKRLDFALLAEVSRLPALGSLLFVGPVAENSGDEMARLAKRSSKVVMVGAQPHNKLPAWMQLIDVALIPYRTAEFNRFCSPMRLFDHLAAGRPIVATSACPQVRDFVSEIKVADGEAFVSCVVHALKKKEALNSNPMLFRPEKETWSARAAQMYRDVFSAMLN
jgi:hypothetical protein